MATVTPMRAARAAGSRDQPLSAEVRANQRITFGGDKDIRHIELALSDSGLHYEPGDALGIWPRNPAPPVESVLDTRKLDGDSPVKLAAQALPLRAWLSDRRELTPLARPFMPAPPALPATTGNASPTGNVSRI